MNTNPFKSKNDPKWCPGCGDFAVLRALTDTWKNSGIPREDFLLVSGIGCSSRLPYYIETYGIHSLHGRAPTVAMGAKLSRPELSVWIATGDGDALSIGAGHFVHLIRKNPDIKVLLFNNEIYGLTKGQFSPTSADGLKTKSSPGGAINRPVNPLSLAINSGATFAARVVDTDLAMMKKVFAEATVHKGVAVIEILTNCIIFNDGAFAKFEDRKLKKENLVELNHGEPLVYGENGDKGIAAEGFALRLSHELGKPPLVMDVAAAEPTLSLLLAGIQHGEMPLPVGVFRKVREPTYEEKVWGQKTSSVTASFEDFSKMGNTWTQ